MMKINIFKKSIVFLSVIFVLLSVQIFQNYDNLSEDWDVFENDDLTLNYPKSWNVKLDLNQLVFFSVTSELSSVKDKFAENVNIVKEKAKGGSLEGYFDRSVSTMKNVLNLKPLSETSGYNFEIPYKEVLYNGKMYKKKFTICQRMFYLNDHVFIISSTSSKKEYKTYQSTFKKIMDSVKFK